ncbi:hypothetical protein AAC387_Pa02g2738 [Persea americana]
MAEDPQLAARSTDVKRKYEDPSPTPPPATRRPTGFSAPIISPSPDSSAATAPPPSFNSVPVDEIQAAKQRAQEIAARLFSSAEAKRPRIENGGEDSNGNGFGSATNDLTQKPAVQQFGMPVAYGLGSSKKIDIPNGKVGVIIGKSGETIKYLQLQSGAKIQVTRDMDADPTSLTRPVELVGTPEQVSKAEQLINDVLAEAEAGNSGTVTGRRSITGQVGGVHFTMKVPNNKVGLIIGKGGEAIKNMQARSGARIQLIPLHLPPGDTSTERTVHIDGTQEQIESAKQLVNEVVSENRLRNPPMAGGYPQQRYRPPQPVTNWGPTGQPTMQQPGYGYMQPGAYPGAPPQYMSQPPYTGYPPQPTSGGYSSGWDQTPVPPNQQTAPGSGYDYYSQQPQQQQPAPGVSSTPADTNYTAQGTYGESNYSQPAPGQQGYSQDISGAGYHSSGPHLGYAQPQSNAQPGYDQQQGYNQAPTYGSMVNPSQDGATPSYGTQVGSTQVAPAQQVPPSAQPSAQAYTAQQPTNPTSYPSQGAIQPGYGISPTSQPGYGSQPLAQAGYVQAAPVTQPGYGQPQGQKPPSAQGVYGQAQQLPTSQAGYVQPAPVQPGYSHSGYVHQDSSHHRAPPTGYSSGAPQPGYGQPQSHGALTPVAQPSFGQQQSQQPYGSGSYGGGYSQPSVYSADSAVASGAQSVVPGVVAKASPKS